mmetsp:Transcript_19483/g.42351  ORF Transcript_19483/g.42351 Transcript_19483/m.42351 type:complete len:173 (+) Transcript_19483:95-613(+)
MEDQSSSVDDQQWESWDYEASSWDCDYHEATSSDHCYLHEPELIRAHSEPITNLSFLTEGEDLSYMFAASMFEHNVQLDDKSVDSDRTVRVSNTKMGWERLHNSCANTLGNASMVVSSVSLGEKAISAKHEIIKEKSLSDCHYQHYPYQARNQHVDIRRRSWPCKRRVAQAA